MHHPVGPYEVVVHQGRDTLLIELKSPFTGYALLSLSSTEKRRGNAKGGVYLLSR